uniref:Putative secreted protein n=1 Tax=Panstrongylus lignarius TaxID=156445 RepID=A0A224XUP5_9HEMI
MGELLHFLFLRILFSSTALTVTSFTSFPDFTLSSLSSLSIFTLISSSGKSELTTGSCIAECITVEETLGLPRPLLWFVLAGEFDETEVSTVCSAILSSGISHFLATPFLVLRIFVVSFFSVLAPELDLRPLFIVWNKATEASSPLFLLGLPLLFKLSPFLVPENSHISDAVLTE